MYYEYYSYFVGGEVDIKGQAVVHAPSVRRGVPCGLLFLFTHRHSTLSCADIFFSLLPPGNVAIVRARPRYGYKHLPRLVATPTASQVQISLYGISRRSRQAVV